MSVPGSASHVERHRKEIRAYFERQRAVVLPEGATVLDGFSRERWDRELAELVITLAVPTVQAFGDEIAERYGVTIDARDLAPFLVPYARITAESTNRVTAEKLEEAAGAEDPREAASHVFDIAAGTRALQLARSKVTTEANLGRTFGAKTAGLRTKRWVVTSGNPRSTHARLNREEVPLARNFSNGAEWPGDPRLKLDERAGCTCLVDFRGPDE